MARPLGPPTDKRFTTEIGYSRTAARPEARSMTTLRTRSNGNLASCAAERADHLCCNRFAVEKKFLSRCVQAHVRRSCCSEIPEFKKVNGAHCSLAILSKASIGTGSFGRSDGPTVASFKKTPSRAASPARFVDLRRPSGTGSFFYPKLSSTCAWDLVTERYPCSRGEPRRRTPPLLGQPFRRIWRSCGRRSALPFRANRQAGWME